MDDTNEQSALGAHPAELYEAIIRDLAHKLARAEAENSRLAAITARQEERIGYLTANLTSELRARQECRERCDNLQAELRLAQGQLERQEAPD